MVDLANVVLESLYCLVDLVCQAWRLDTELEAKAEEGADTDRDC